MKPLDPAAAVLVRGQLMPHHNSINGCFGNVHRIVLDLGGEVVIGWLEGETLFPDRPVIQTWIHHCVWRMPDGELRDVTPQIFGTTSLGVSAVLPKWSRVILDPEATLLNAGDGLVVTRNPRYTALIDDPRVRQAIVYLERADQALAAGEMGRDAYWAERAFKVLKPWASGVPMMAAHQAKPFALPTDDEE